MPNNMNRQPLARGNWVLRWDSRTILSQSFDGRGYWIDIDRLRTPLDVVELVCKTKSLSFVKSHDICSLVDLIRIFLRERLNR